MSLPLISFKEYKKSISGKCLFNGHFWTTDGDLFEVKTRRITTRSPHPGCRTVGFTKTDTFHVSEKKRITITLEQIGDDDVVYDENGDFIGTRKGHNPQRKGVIFIRKYKKKYNLTTPPDLDDRYIYLSEYEDVPFKSAEAKTNLSPEAYSKIFTHILSMDKDIKKDLEGLRNGKVSVEIEIGGVRSYHNMTEKERHPYENANAYGSARNNIVVAKIGAGVANTDDTYATIWNVLSLLGVHEMKHVTLPWTNDHWNTHHLNYLFQKGHHSWENTTPSYKEDIYNKLNGKGFYPTYEKYLEDDSSIYRDHIRFGIFPSKGKKFGPIENRIINILKDSTKISEMDDYFRKRDKKEGRESFYKEGDL